MFQFSAFKLAFRLSGNTVLKEQSNGVIQVLYFGFLGNYTEFDEYNKFSLVSWRI